ncbi:MAG: hypothetical protein ACI8RZ_004545 [Myxococcota bacterium]|jgi:hypothetical protein
MSFFDRLSNIGRGAIKNAFSSEEDGPSDPIARQLENLHKAYTSGILTAAEYEVKRAALVGGIPQSAPTTRTTARTAPRTPIDPPADVPAPDEGPWPGDGPVKRTL